MISLNIEKTLGFISKENVFAYEAQVKAAQEALEAPLPANWPVHSSRPLSVMTLPALNTVRC